MTYKVRSIMRREYVAILLAGFITTMTASAASYMGTQKNLSVNNVKLDKLELEVANNRKVHDNVYLALKELNETNTQTQITMARIATVIELRLGKSGED